MKITAARRSRAEIISDRDKFDQERDALVSKRSAEYEEYRKEDRRIQQSIIAQVNEALSSIHGLDLRVHVEQSFRSRGYQVTVYSNDSNVHGKDKALSWNWSAELGADGELIKDSGSWSGLQAVTEEQLESLRKSVTALEILNSLDWTEILSSAVPDYTEYVKTNPSSLGERPDFERELIEIDIADAIESGDLLLSNKRASSLIYFGVIKETPSMYEVYEVPKSWLDAVGEDEDSRWSSIDEVVKLGKTNAYKITKDKFIKMLATPLTVVKV